MKGTKLKVLFVCTINRMRSATAQEIYKEDARFEVASAGTATSARQVLDSELLVWADVILVMEKEHRNFIRKHFPTVYQQKKIVCLYIADEYDFMQPVLQCILRVRIEEVYQRGLLS